MKHAHLKIAALGAAALLALTGCGGGSNTTLPEPPPLSSGSLPADPLAAIPTASTATPSALLTYQFLVLQVDATKSDKAEPIDLTNVTLPSSDNTEPADV